MKQQNPFDQFDTQIAAPSQGNPFDQFDVQEVAVTAPEPQKPGFIEGIPAFLKDKYVEPVKNFGRGAVDAAKSRVLGVSQLVSPDASPEKKSLMQDLAALYQAKNKQGIKGAGGVAGEIAGDPLTYLPSPASVGGMIARGVQGVAKGIGQGALSGVTTPTKEGDSRLGNMLVGGGIGGAASVAVPAVTKLASLASEAPGALSNATQFFLGSRTEKGAQDNATKYIASQLLKEGISPEELAQKASDAQAAGIGTTLPEFTHSSSLLSAQKRILGSHGKGTNYLRNYLEDRTQKIIPAKLNEIAQPLNQKLTDASKKYNDIFQNNNVPVDTTELEQNLANKISQANPGSQAQSLAQSLANIVDSAKQSGGSLLNFHNAKMEIDNMIKSAPTPGLKSILKRDTADTVNQLVNAMDNASPDYAATRRLYQEGSPAKQILNAMQTVRKSGDNISLPALQQKLFGNQAKRDALKNAMEPGQYEGLNRVFSGIDDVLKGKMFGSDTVSNLEGQAALEGATGAQGIQAVTNPPKALEMLGKWYVDKTRQKDYAAIAKAFTDPDIAALGKAMRGMPRNSPEARQALNAFATKVLATYGGKEIQQ